MITQQKYEIIIESKLKPKKTSISINDRETAGIEIMSKQLEMLINTFNGLCKGYSATLKLIEEK
jgi:hypothetical protein